MNRKCFPITLNHWILGGGDPCPVQVKFRACPLTSVIAFALFLLIIMGMDVSGIVKENFAIKYINY